MAGVILRYIFQMVRGQIGSSYPRSVYMLRLQSISMHIVRLSHSTGIGPMLKVTRSLSIGDEP